MTKKITSDDILLQDGLVAYVDPLDGFTKQITVEQAVKVAEVNAEMKAKLIELGVLKADKKEDDK